MNSYRECHTSFNELSNLIFSWLLQLFVLFNCHVPYITGSFYRTLRNSISIFRDGAFSF